jgi:membrane associated rhomboid family serine protease
MTPAVRALVYTNIGVFLLGFFAPNLVVGVFGLIPSAVFEQLQLWRVATYLFVHDPQGFGHILFNMLALWMFGVDLERRWGSKGFLRYYFITGIGAGIATAVVSLLPFDATRPMYAVPTIGASGAIYGLLLAWALLFPYRQILFMFIFPLQARVAAILMGAMAFLAAVSGRNGSVAEATHLFGLVIGWVYLQGPRNMRLELQYRLTRWRMERMRKRFNVHRGGRGGDDWSGRVH